MIFQLVVIGAIAWAVYRWQQKSESKSKRTQAPRDAGKGDSQHNWQINVFVVNPDQLKGLLPSKDEKKNEDKNE